MSITGHEFLNNVPEGTENHDVLRGRIQGADFKDREWADDQQIDKFLRIFPDIILAVVDTRLSENGFECRSFDGERVITYVDDDGLALPPDKKIIRLAYTGNHFLSVMSSKRLPVTREKLL